MAAFNLYETVTDRMIEALDAGVVPWRKPWNATGEDGLQKNLNSGRPYRGINQFLLTFSEYDSPYWMTFKGMKKLGGTLKKINGEDEKGTGQKSTVVVFWKRIVKTEPDPMTGEKSTRVVPLLRYFRVFNSDQVEWTEEVPARIKALEIPAEDKPEFITLEIAAEIVAGMPNPPKKLKHGGDRAFYRPATDEYKLPKPEDFDSPQQYHHVEFHELAHSTGHKDRLNREELTKLTTTFGDADYSKEELTAEMTAAFLDATCGFSEVTFDNSAAYIDNWKKKLRGDNKLVVIAAARAQKAADFIQDIKWEERADDE